MKKRIAIFLVAVMALVALMGCTTSNQSAAPEPNKPAAEQPAQQAPASTDDTVNMEPVIGTFDVVQRTGKEPMPSKKDKLVIGHCSPGPGFYHMLIRKGIEDGLAELKDQGFEISYEFQMPSEFSGNGLVEQQNILEQWISQGEVNCIINCVDDDSMFGPVFDKAAAAGIPIIVYGLGPDELKCDSYISLVGYSQHDSAQVVGEWLGGIKKDVDLKVSVLKGTPGAASDARIRGFEDGLKAVSAKYDVVNAQYTEWDRNKGSLATEDMLSSNPETNVIFAMYDELTVAAAAILSNKGLTGKVTLCGYDVTPESLDFLINGTIDCSTYNGTYDCGKTMAAVAYEYVIKGNMVGKTSLFTPQLIDQAAAKAFDRNLLVLPE